MPVIPVPFTFFDPAGAPLAGGKVVVYLNTDIAANGPSGSQVVAKRVQGILDNAGSVTLNLWPNVGLHPPNSVYFIEAFTAQGQPAWRGEMTVT